MSEYVLTNTQYYQDIADAIRQKKAEVEASSTAKKGSSSETTSSSSADNEK